MTGSPGSSTSSGRRWHPAAALILLFVGLLVVGVFTAVWHTHDGGPWLRHDGGQGPGQDETPDRPRDDQGGRRARVWHVSVHGSADGTGAPDRPFQTIQPAIDAANPGDTVLVGPGSYRGGLRSTRAGRARASIRWVGHDARVTGDATYLIEIIHDHLEVLGFTLVGGKSAVRLYGASNVRVLGNTIRDTGGECIRVKHRSRNNEIAHNRISGCGRTGFDLTRSRKNGEGVYIGTAPEQRDEDPGGQQDRSDHNWVHDNRIESPAECVDVKEDSANTVVERNHCTGGRDPRGAGFSLRGDHNTLRANTVRGGAGAGIRLGGDDKEQGVGSTVVGNTVLDAAGYGVKVMRGPQAVICGNRLRAGLGATNNGGDPGRPCR